ncbi:MAG: 1,4-alpha-glucan branching protein GlgB [Flintibacter sp.]|uniref:1,4-alpha-glucan branching protein GlgB n=1 Tax=Flintibacter sp. TaxID=1918624 RepID=UPI002673E50D|nr:1,4-alpha-glucan branching protein GlgB [Flintibacter sp.]MCI6150226.1 1,4-alpha-glucan branching protein GlgB [Flintibacter sp.]MDY5039312.1 1,4-alpha-glucan branching protein GlgB [Lawsonibacter sp.]
MDFHGFYTGKVFDAYQYLGAHITDSGVVFRTFAPGAQKVSLIGECSQWREYEMNRVYDGNFWECYVDGASAGSMYKYRIYEKNGGCMDHCDPYGFGMELRPNSASIVRDMNSYQFHDSAWMLSRSDCKNRPLNIYELHFGSFRKPSERVDDWYTYEEMADILIPYLTQNGYNYLEIIPLNEHPCDESWGYQSTGFFSPTSRYGTADQLKAFVDACHQNDIGVIMDFVPVHFAVDGYALAQFDGTALYEYPHAAVGVSEWGSLNFMHSRGEVRSFLQSAANYWLTEFHVDGLRMDAISRMIYWQGDPGRGVNLDAVKFLQYMNRRLKALHPTAILIAEDSTSYPDVTKSVSENGLGFDYKWDMGWMNDTLDYCRTAPAYRGMNYHKLTFSMMYYYHDQFLLPLSHDEVVHGKATILQKMHGHYEEKFPQARILYMYMYAHPGKKLNFMGNELGQLREWDEKRQQDWNLLDFPAHREFHRFMIDLNHIYLQHLALSEKDYDPDGFRWLDCHQEERCIYAFERIGSSERIIAVFNFSNREQIYQLKIQNPQTVQVLLSSNWVIYGGDETNYGANLTTKNNILELTMKPYTALYMVTYSTNKN